MKTSRKPATAVRNRGEWNGWSAWAIALVSFAAGSLITARLTYARRVRADSNRVFELMVYHTTPGKEPELESIFRDVSKMQEKHTINVIGCWVPNDDPAWANTFVCLVAHPSLEEAKKNWRELHADPAFPPYRQQASEILEKTGNNYRVDEVYMRPTDYSAMK